MRPPIHICVLFGADVLLCLAHLINVGLGKPFETFFNLNAEGNLPSWYSASKLLVIALLLASLTVGTYSRSSRTSFMLVGLTALFLLLSVDEGAQIHEWFGSQTDFLLPGGTREGTPFEWVGIWMFVVGVPAAVLILGALFVARKYVLTDPHIFRLYMLGMSVFLVGAVGVEAVANAVADAGWRTVLQITTEEFLEMIGVTILVWGTTELLRARGFTLRFTN